MATFRAKFQRDGSSGERKNSLGLEAARLNKLFDILDNGSDPNANLKRVHVRWPFRQESLTFRVIEGFGGRREFKVAARNLSNSGLSVLHNTYVHPGTDCEVDMPTNNPGKKAHVAIPGKVARCKHIQGVVHEIGIGFNKPIDARQFLSMDRMPAYYSLEMIDATKMEGTLLHVDDSALDRRLFAHYLADTKVIIKHAETIEDAKVKARDTYDLIVLDQRLPDGDGVSFAMWMRDNGILTPVIALTADTSYDTQRQLTAAEINGLLLKPVDKGTLLRAVSEYMRMGDETQNSLVDHSMKELTGTFLNELSSMIDELRACQQNGDALSAYTISLRIKGTAPSLGFDRLANVSDRAAAALAASMSVEESQKQIDALLDACERVRHRRAS
jgi:CheY-like chemotaxis protein